VDLAIIEDALRSNLSTLAAFTRLPVLSELMKPLIPQELSALDPATLVERYQTGIWRYLRALGCDPAEADDLTQETFLAVLQHTFVDHGPAAVAAYLRRVAHNLLVSARRRAGKVMAVEDIEQFDRAWEDWAGNDEGEARLDALRGCLQQLTDRARMALDMRFRDRSSRSEIAEALGITEHGAKNLMQRAKQQLRACIERKTA
jgi:RNA polymerase sigma-70 factor, ECF subfamily